LPQGVIPTLHVICLPAAFANTLVCLLWKDELIGLPEIAVALASPIGLRNLFPKFTTGCFAAIPDDKGHDLACPTTHDRPNPAFVPPFVDKGPHFIGFQYIFGFGRQKRVFKFRIDFVFFLAKMPESDDSRQRCVGYHAYWSVHDRQTRFVLFALRYIHVLDRGHHVFRSLCTRIVDCHWHYDRFLRYFCHRNFDICKH
jgi:hypothetical protein